MLTTVTYIYLFSLLVTVVLFLFRTEAITRNFSFLIFCCELLICEIILRITASCGLNNHVIANINTLFYYPLAILLLFNIWDKSKGRAVSNKYIKYFFLVIFLIAWIFENFVFASINFYNPFLSSIVSLILVIISIYLINVLLFVKNNNLLMDSDGLILVGMLIRSFFAGLLLLFMNYRMKYSNDFYEKILLLVNIALIISNICFTLSVLCLPKKKKYTWPF